MLLARHSANVESVPIESPTGQKRCCWQDEEQSESRCIESAGCIAFLWLSSSSCFSCFSCCCFVVVILIVCSRCSVCDQKGFESSILSSGKRNDAWRDLGIASSSRYCLQLFRFFCLFFWSRQADLQWKTNDLLFFFSFGYCLRFPICCLYCRFGCCLCGCHCFICCCCRDLFGWQHTRTKGQH